MRGIKKFNDDEDLTDGGLDAGLSLLLAATPPGVERTPPGVERTHAEIAFVCGCNHQDIWHIENRAKRKIKAEFERRGINPESILR